ncbi:hypothetical protein [Aestuariivirga sp.]|uniref:hypothetical protein n=1 Tax=Aestuariivirga sp. TaxID=2650926 RepID=UPI003019A842
MRADEHRRNRSPDESVRLLLAAAVILVFLGVAIYLRELMLAEPDLWWHIKTGLWMWQHGKTPNSDFYSYTFAGHPWMAKEWLSQLIFAATYTLGNWSAVSALAMLVLALATGLLYWSISGFLRPSLAAAITLVAFLVTCNTFTIRPHLLTLPLLVIWTDQLFKSSLNVRAPSFLLLVVISLWANLHAAFTMGFVIAFFAFLDFIENGGWWKKEALWKWLVFLALCPVVTLLHPYSYRAMMATLWVFRPNEGTVPLGEWQPFNAQLLPIHATVLLGLAFGAMTSGFRLGLARALLIVLLTYLFLAHLRYAFFLFPVLAVIAPAAISKQFPKLSADRWRAGERDPLEQRMHDAFRPVMSVVCGIAATMLGLQLFVLHTAPSEKVSPSAAIAYAKAHGLSGHVFNDYNFGGPLIFNDIPTFIDGRSDQLFIGDISKEFEASLKDEKTLIEVLSKHDMQWTLFTPEDPRTKMLDKLPGWKRVFADENAIIHQRQDALSQ